MISKRVINPYLEEEYTERGETPGTWER